MVGENEERNGGGNVKGRPVWAERDREQGKGEAGASGVGNKDRRAKRLCW